MTTRCLMCRVWLGALLFLTAVGCAATDGITNAPAVTGPALGLRQPVGIALHPAGGVLVTDAGNNRIVHLDTHGKLLEAWGTYGAGPGQFSRPLGVAVDPVGRIIYVADYLNDRIQMLDTNGQPLGQWDTFGAGDHFFGPADVAVGVDGSVYVVEFNGGRVIKLDRHGKLIKTWGSPGHAGGQFYYPTRITTAPDGLVWVTDAYNHRLVVYTPDGEQLRTLGTSGPPGVPNLPGDKPGQFNVAGGVAFDRDGGVWVADFFNSRLQRFTNPFGSQAQVTLWTGENSRIGPLSQPTDLVFDPQLNKLYVVDFGHDRVVQINLGR